MKNYTLFLSVVILSIFFTTVTSAQFDSLKELRFSAGFTDPRGPDSFYDYWTRGFKVEAEALYHYSEEYDVLTAIEYNRFSFDEKRFFTKVKVKSQDVSVEGATTSLIAITGNMMYDFNAEDGGMNVAKPYLLAGGGLLVSWMTESVINYPFSTVTKGSVLSFQPCLRIGCGLRTGLTEKTAWFAEMNYMYGLLTAQTVNTDFMTIRAGISVVQ